MLPIRFSFADYDNPTRYHLSRVLAERGHQRVLAPEQADFHEGHLALSQTGRAWLEQKHLLANLTRKHCAAHVPLTFAVDEDNWSVVLQAITDNYHSHGQQFVDQKPGQIWLLKPALLNNGTHIHVFDRISLLWDHYVQPQRLGGPHVIQRYITNPKLLAGYKHSLRFYCVITNYAGIFLYPRGYANVSLTPFEAGCWQNKAMHLTNEHLDGALCNVQQIATQHYPYNKIVLAQALQILRQLGRSLSRVVPEFRQRGVLQQWALFGVDFLLDAADKLWLIEVNDGPHFPTTQPHALDEDLFHPFWQALVAEFVLPLAGQAYPPQRQFQKICGPQRWWHK